MISNLLKKVFGSRNERLVKKLLRSVSQINALESRDRAVERRGPWPPRPPSCAAAWPTAPPSKTCCPRPSRSSARPRKRTLGMRHFDVQIVGGMVLHEGKIAEMRTGEGKTLVATLAAYLERPARPGCPRGHGERLPGPARRRLDGARLPLPRPERGGHQFVRRHGPGPGVLPLSNPPSSRPRARATATCAP